MKALVRLLPVFKLIPVLLITLLLSLLLKDYLLITFQKSYLVLISGFLFCLSLCVIEYFRAHPKQGIKLGFRDIRPQTYFIVLIIILLVVFLGIKEAQSILEKSAGAHSNYLNLYEVLSLTGCYQQFGLIKRGFIPTLVNLISSSYDVQLFTTTLLGLLFFAGGVTAVAFSRQYGEVSRKIFFVVFILSPIGIYSQFKFIAGPYDMAMIGFFFLALASNDRPASVVFDIIGLLIHEAYIFLRLPFLLFNLYATFTGNEKSKKNRLAFQLFELVVLGIGFMVMSSNLVRPDVALLKKNYFEHFSNLPPPRPGDFDAFDPISKNTTLQYQLNLMNEYHHSKDFYTYFIPLLVCAAAIAILSYRFTSLKGREKRLDIFFSFVAFLMPLLLSFIGTDIGRWLNFGFIAWFGYYILVRPKLFAEAQVSYNCIFGILLVLFVFSPLGIFEHPLMFALMK